MSVALLALVALVVAVQAWLIPAAIARLPEPSPSPRLVRTDGVDGAAGAEDRPEDETPLERVLREEGPKEPYVEVARIRHLAPACVGVSLLLALAVVARLGDHPVSWVIALLTPTLVLLSVVDWRTRLLPRAIVLPVTGVLIALALVEWAATHHTHVLVRTLVAMVVARSFFWVLWAIRRAGMGFGDVRLAALVGLVLGRVSWNAWLIGLYGGLLIFAGYGIALTVVRRDVRTLKRHLPYGPFMVAGLYVGVLLSGSLTIV